jgi:hypothetical protein
MSYGNTHHSVAQYGAAAGKTVTLWQMSPERDNSKLVWVCLYLAVGLMWLFITLARFHRGGDWFTAVGALFFLADATFRFREWLHPKPVKKRTALWTRLEAWHRDNT